MISSWEARAAVLDPHIILLRWHGQFLLGLCGRGKDGKLWALSLDEVPIRITPRQVLWETNLRISQDHLTEWITKANHVAEELELTDMWQATVGLDSPLTIEEMSTLIWGADYSTYQLSGLLLYLHTARTPYFDRKDYSFIPWTSEFLQSHLTKIEETRFTDQQYSEFINWLQTGVTPINWTSNHQKWFTYIWDYTLHGNGSSTAKSARKILHELPIDSEDYQRFAFSLLQDRNIISEDEHLGLHRLSVKTGFSEELELAAEALGKTGTTLHTNRLDLTTSEVFSIDEVETMDLDDAISISETDEGFSLGIHITDVSAIFESRTAIDQEARQRLTSLYLPEGVIPMLPAALSYGIGSLITGSVKPAMTVLIQLDTNFGIKQSNIFLTSIKNQIRLSYLEAEEGLQNPNSPLHRKLNILHRLSTHLHNQRISLGAIELNRPEIKITVDPDTGISVGAPQLPGAGRQLVAELMILANELLAKFVVDNRLPAIFRIQEQVNLDGIADTAIDAVRQYQIIRRLRPTILSTKPRPHALLGVQSYIQATSPLRRFQDLVMQRQITHYIKHGSTLLDEPIVASLIHETESRLRDLGRLEEERKRYWMNKSLLMKVGNIFGAIVLEKRNNYAIVEVIDYLIRTSLYVGPLVNIGQTIDIRLQEVDLWKMETRFTFDWSR